ncbi:MAG: hypothetical protein IPG06_19945 [Haliea sp.]|nr:hypothetical protein [Haliea sp.]
MHEADVIHALKPSDDGAPARIQQGTVERLETCRRAAQIQRPIDKLDRVTVALKQQSFQPGLALRLAHADQVDAIFEAAHMILAQQFAVATDAVELVESPDQ